jgi:hypothetical protein
MGLVALLLVVSGNGAPNVGAGVDEHGKVMARQQPGGNDSAHVRGCLWCGRMFPEAQCRKVVRVRVIAAGDGMTRGKGEMMTRSQGQPHRVSGDREEESEPGRVGKRCIGERRIEGMEIECLPLGSSTLNRGLDSGRVLV